MGFFDKIKKIGIFNGFSKLTTSFMMSWRSR